MDSSFRVVSASTRPKPSLARYARILEAAVCRHPRTIIAVQWFMIALYFALIVVPPLLPATSEQATPFSDFVMFSQFVIWGVWWPFVLLSMIGFGRAWCGIFCPEGALSGLASRWSANRPLPAWMRFGWVPLVAFIAITVLGQIFEVDERPLPQLLILGGSTVAAVVVGFMYTRRSLVWCRFLCPVSLLFGVFSRLGAMHFEVNRARLDSRAENSDGGAKRGPCPVLIHLPVMSTNRYCVMCFRCAGWRDAIHLGFRSPGEELGRIHHAEPLFWEVMFLYGGAIGLPLGVFYGEFLDWGGAALVALLLGSAASGIVVLSLATWLSAHLISGGQLHGAGLRERFTCIGYLYTPLSLFSLFLGLSKPTFEYLESAGFPALAADVTRTSLLAIGAVWSLHVACKILRRTRPKRGPVWTALWPQVLGVALVLALWWPILNPLVVN